METIEIGLENTSKVMEVTKVEGLLISVSCGGGMGGSFWNEFSKTTAINVNEKFIMFDTLKEKNVSINTNNIVKIVPSVYYKIKYVDKDSFNTNRTYVAIVPSCYKVHYNENGVKKFNDDSDWLRDKFEKVAKECGAIFENFMK